MTVLSMLLKRLRCPAHGVVVQGVPFARPGSRFTTCFEDIIAWLVARADKTSKTTVSRFARIAWRTVGAICERVVAEQLDATRFEGLVNIGVDEISWRKHHRYLTLVSDHATKEDRVGRPGEERRDTGWVLYRDRPGEHGVDWGCQHGPLRDKLVAAILAGRKTTTTSLLAEFAVDDEPLPRISRYQQVLDSSGRPAAIFETVAVGQLPLGCVPLTHVMDEGEGHSSVAQWRADYERYWHTIEMRDYLQNPTFAL